MALFQASVKQPRRKNIFISYREKDTAAETGRLVDLLKQYFYDDQIFMDIDKIEPGVDFTDVINHSLGSCDVMLAVIGPNWTATNSETGKSRIMQSNDWVRQEIATALERKIRVVPVLVDGAALPSAEELPADLHPLINRQAYEISNKRWRYDTENLVAFLEKSVGIQTRKNNNIDPVQPSAFSISSFVKYGLIGVGAIFIVLIIYYAIAGNSDKTNAGGNNYNGPKQEQPYEEDGNTPIEPNQGGYTPKKLDEEPVDPPKVQYANVSGIWYDNFGIYYLEIMQNGNQVEVYSYAMNGEKTGEGVGTVNGRNLSFKITIVNIGIHSVVATLSPNNTQLTGTLKDPNNRDSYNPIVLNKQIGN